MSATPLWPLPEVHVRTKQPLVRPAMLEWPCSPIMASETRPSPTLVPVASNTSSATPPPEARETTKPPLVRLVIEENSFVIPPTRHSPPNCSGISRCVGLSATVVVIRGLQNIRHGGVTLLVAP